MGGQGGGTGRQKGPVLGACSRVILEGGLFGGRAHRILDDCFGVGQPFSSL